LSSYERAAERHGRRGFPGLLPAIGGSVFLVLAMDNPLGGIIKVSSGPMQRAIAHMLP
jgi:hypothetical protein